MRKALIAIVIVLATMQLYAASWHMGIEAGYTLGLYDQRGGVREHETISNGHAFEVAIPFECRFGDIFSLSSALRYVGKAYDVENIFIDELTYRYRDVEHFLELPLSLRLSLDLEPVRMFIGAGAYIGVRFMSTEAGRFNYFGISTEEFDDYWAVRNLDADVDNLFSAGLLVEAGVGFDVTSAIELAVLGRYQRSFTDLDVGYGRRGHTYRYLDTVSVTLSCSFLLGGGE